MTPTDLLNAGLPQTFNLLKMQHLQSTIKQSAIKQGKPVPPLLKSSTLVQTNQDQLVEIELEN